MVTLHTEGVDWNPDIILTEECEQLSPSTRRVWIEIGISSVSISSLVWSPSTRRVWIEICRMRWICITYTVTLHTEGVDWNTPCNNDYRACNRSPSTRRVWIEIWQEKKQMKEVNKVTLHTEGVDWNPLVPPHRQKSLTVTLHTEGVDWNCNAVWKCVGTPSHPPHGGCGLKCDSGDLSTQIAKSPSTRRVWIEILIFSINIVPHFRHPPHGGCGLKS